MTVVDLTWHLLNFAAPAAALAVLVALAGLWVLPPRGGWLLGWWPAVLVNFLVGLAVLAGGLAWFGRDGKMTTYAAMVVAVATSQWLAGRGWRR